jgi:hypothetical protein
MEERIKKLEIVSERLMRRARKHVVGLITPYPISNAVFGEKVEGAILRYMFPCDGVIIKGMVNLVTKPKKWVSVNVKLFSDARSIIKGFTIEKKTLTIQPNIPVTAGDCLEISIAASPEDVVKEVWISFLWTPSMKDVTAKSFLISELEDDISNRKALITE